MVVLFCKVAAVVCSNALCLALSRLFSHHHSKRSKSSESTFKDPPIRMPSNRKWSPSQKRRYDEWKTHHKWKFASPVEETRKNNWRVSAEY